MAKAKNNVSDNGSKRRFTTVEKTYVLHNLNKLSPEEIAKELGRTPVAVKKVIKTLTQANESSEQATAETQPAQPQHFDPQSNAKAPEGIKAGDLMAGGEKQGRPGVVMMTSAASQALDEFKKTNTAPLNKPHDSAIYRIRK